MPTDVSSSRDGENQRSDQTSTRRDASHNGGQVRDFATHQYQLYEQQQDAKHQRDGKIPAKLIKCARVAENRMPVEKLKLPDTSGLKGGMARDANDFLSQGQNGRILLCNTKYSP